ncbi:hypothetical protein BDR04DRAFT_1162044 [Suillus decipiens]|nr:hypothetical protein BDR04DRAFT_1162044 [Suillus decipiens]
MHSLCTLWPRSLEFYNLLDVAKVNNFENNPFYPFVQARNVRALKVSSMVQSMKDNTPTIPFMRITIAQLNLHADSLQRHLEKFSYSLEMGTELHSFEQLDEGGIAEIFDSKWIIGANGTKGLNSGVQDADVKLVLVQKGFADKSPLETHSVERLPVISEMLGVTTAILDKATSFSTTVLNEFVDGYLEAGDRAPYAPNMLQVGSAEADSLGDAIPVLGTLEAYDKSVVRSAVALLSSASVTPIASLADLVLVDREGYAYSAYLIKAGQTKVFVIRPDGIIQKHHAIDQTSAL